MVKEDVLIAIDAEAVEAARAAALPEAHLLLLVETFQALADPTRARMLYARPNVPCVYAILLFSWGCPRRRSRTSFAFYGIAAWSNPDEKVTLSTT